MIWLATFAEPTLVIAISRRATIIADSIHRAGRLEREQAGLSDHSVGYGEQALRRSFRLRQEQVPQPRSQAFDLSVSIRANGTQGFPAARLLHIFSRYAASFG
jgi:hypothetical protein